MISESARRLARPLLWLSFVALWSRSALAESFRVSYAAPQGCPARHDFIRAVEQRVPRWHHSEQAAEREIAVRVRSTESGFFGTISLARSAPVREVEGPHCDSVVRAMALVAAIALDPDAALSTDSPSEERSMPQTEPQSESNPYLRPPPSLPAVPGVAVGTGVGLMLGPAPAGLYGVEGHADLADASRRFLVRVAGAHLVSQSVALGTGHAHFQLTHAELGGCYRPIRERRLFVFGCLIIDAGSMQAAGEATGAVIRSKTSNRLWMAAGGRVGLGVPPLEPLELHTSFGALVPWREQSYVFENPRENLYTSSLVALDFRVGMTVAVR